MHGGINIIFVTNGCPKWFHIVQKIHQKLKGKYSKFGGLILDCIQKITELVQREDECVSTMNQSPQHSCHSGHCQW